MATTLRGDDNFDTASPIPAGNFTAKAWVNFDGTGTVAIRADGNVSSITDNGTGDPTVNFTAAMSDANYGDTYGDTSGTTGAHYMPYIVLANYATYKTSSSLRFATYTPGAQQDANSVSVVISR